MLTADDVLTRWRLETGEACQNVDELHKRIKAEQREEKKLEDIRKALDKTTGSLDKSVAKLARTSLTDYKSAIDMVTGATKKALAILDDFFEKTEGWKEFKKTIEDSTNAAAKAITTNQTFKAGLKDLGEGAQLCSSWIQLMAGGMDVFADSSWRATVALSRFLSVMPAGIGTAGGAMRDVLKALEEQRSRAKEMAPGKFAPTVTGEELVYGGGTKKGKAAGGGIPASWFKIPTEEAPGPPSMIAMTPPLPLEQAVPPELPQQISQITSGLWEAQIAAKGFGAALAEAIGTDTWTTFYESGAQALGQFTASLWSAADTAIQTGQSFGDVAKASLKSITLGLASELTAKGTAALVEAAATACVPGGQILAGTLATKGAILLAGAATVGGIGLGMSAAGWGAPSGAGGGISFGSAGNINAREQSFGRSVQEGDKTIHIHLVIPSTKSGAAMYITDQVLTAKIKAA